MPGPQSNPFAPLRDRRMRYGYGVARGRQAKVLKAQEPKSPEEQREENVKAAKKSGAFGAIRDRYNQQAAPFGLEMDETSRIGPARGRESAPAKPAPAPKAMAAPKPQESEEEIQAKATATNIAKEEKAQLAAREDQVSSGKTRATDLAKTARARAKPLRSAYDELKDKITKYEDQERTGKLTEFDKLEEARVRMAELEEPLKASETLAEKLERQAEEAGAKADDFRLVEQDESERIGVRQAMREGGLDPEFAKNVYGTTMAVADNGKLKPVDPVNISASRVMKDRRRILDTLEGSQKLNAMRDQDARETDPDAWEAGKLESLKGLTDEDLAGVVQGYPIVIDQARRSIESIVADRQQRELERQAELAQLASDNAELLGRKGFKVSQMTEEPDGTRWHNAFHARRASLIAAENKDAAETEAELAAEQAEYERDIRVHNARIAELQARQSKVVQAEQAKRDQALKELESSGQAKAAAQIVKNDAEINERRQKIDSMYAADSPEHKAATAALQADAELKTKGVQEATAKTQEAAQDLYDKWGKGLNYDWSDPKATDSIHERMVKEGKDRGLTEEETRYWLTNMAQADWSKPTVIGGKEIDPETQDVRFLPNGGITVNPSYLLDKEGYESVVGSSNATAKAKEKALEVRQVIAPQLATNAIKMLRGNGTMSDWLDKNTTGTDLERMEQFTAKMKAGGWTQAALMRFQAAAASIPANWLGGAAAVTGDNELAEAKLPSLLSADYWTKRADSYSAAAGAAEKGTNILGKYAAMVAGGIPSVLESIAAGSVGGEAYAAARLFGAAGKAVKISQKSIQAASMAGASIDAGMQSFGGTYLDAYTEYAKDEMGKLAFDAEGSDIKPEQIEQAKTEARNRALTPAILSGLTTAGLTALGGAKGAEAILRRGSQEAIKKQAKTALLKFYQKAGIDIGEEALEEYSDQFVQGAIAQATYNPSMTTDEIFKQAVDAGIVGGILGGGSSAIKQALDRVKPEDQASFDAQVENYAPAADAVPEEVEKLKTMARTIAAVAAGADPKTMKADELESIGWSASGKPGKDAAVYVRDGKTVIKDRVINDLVTKFPTIEQMGLLTEEDRLAQIAEGATGQSSESIPGRSAGQSDEGDTTTAGRDTTETGSASRSLTKGSTGGQATQPEMGVSRAGSSPAPSATSAGVVMMVTRDMRQQLYDKGYTKQQVDSMRPQQAQDAIKAGPVSTPADFQGYESQQIEQANRDAAKKALNTDSKTSAIIVDGNGVTLQMGDRQAHPTQNTTLTATVTDAQLTTDERKEAKRISQEGDLAETQEEWSENRAKQRDLVRRVFERVFENQPQTVDQAAQEAATSKANDLPQPTEAQKQAGNYKMAHIKVSGLDITIENPDGSERSWTNDAGESGVSKINGHYGYIRNTVGADGDHIDTLIKAGTPEDWNGTVYVIHQNKADGKTFDEHKVYIGFESEAEAKKAYKSNYQKGWRGYGGAIPVQMKDLADMVKSGKLKKSPNQSNADEQSNQVDSNKGQVVGPRHEGSDRGSGTDQGTNQPADGESGSGGLAARPGGQAGGEGSDDGSEKSVGQARLDSRQGPQQAEAGGGIANEATKAPPAWSIRTDSGKTITIPADQAANRAEAVAKMAGMSARGDKVRPGTLTEPVVGTPTQVEEQQASQLGYSLPADAVVHDLDKESIGKVVARIAAVLESWVDDMPADLSKTASDIRAAIVAHLTPYLKSGQYQGVIIAPGEYDVAKHGAGYAVQGDRLVIYPRHFARGIMGHALASGASFSEVAEGLIELGPLHEFFHNVTQKALTDDEVADVWRSLDEKTRADFQKAYNYGRDVKMSDADLGHEFLRNRLEMIFTGKTTEEVFGKAIRGNKLYDAIVKLIEALGQMLNDARNFIKGEAALKRYNEALERAVTSARTALPPEIMAMLETRATQEGRVISVGDVDSGAQRSGAQAKAPAIGAPQRVKNFIQANFGSVLEAMNVGLVPNYTGPSAHYVISEDIGGGRKKRGGYIEYNPAKLAERSPGQIMETAREEVIHAALDQALIEMTKPSAESLASGQYHVDFFTQVHDLMTPAERELVKKAYKSHGNRPYYIGSEFARMVIQRELFGGITEQSMLGDKGPATKSKALQVIKKLFQSMLDFMRRLASNKTPAGRQAMAVMDDAIKILKGVEAQQKMVMAMAGPESPEFKAWFGDSKVVDAAGNPVVVLHGTKQVFDTFDLSKAGSNNDTGMWGTGFYFSPQRIMARGYGDKIGRFYLSLQNPLILHANKDWPEIVNQPYDPRRTTHGEEGKKQSDAMRQKLIKAGYDGVMQYERHYTNRMTVPGEKLSQVVAFYPNQIKSATSNNGEFDPSNPSVVAMAAPDLPIQTAVKINNKVVLGKPGQTHYDIAANWIKDNELEPFVRSQPEAIGYAKERLNAKWMTDHEFVMGFMGDKFMDREDAWRYLAGKGYRMGDGWSGILDSLDLKEIAERNPNGPKAKASSKQDDAALLRELEAEIKPPAGVRAMASPVTPAQDAEYMAAVESGDVAKQQAMVDAAAKAAGYDVGPVYHGSRYGFQGSSFDKSRSWGPGFFFSGSERVAKKFAGRLKHSQTLRFYLRSKKPAVFNQSVDEPITIDALYEAIGLTAADVPKNFERDVGQTEIPAWRWYKDDTLLRDLATLGFDSFQGIEQGEAVHALWDPNQIKSADPITRDADGNVIPLSQRFNTASNDIRFMSSPALPVDPQLGLTYLGSDEGPASQAKREASNPLDPQGGVSAGRPLGGATTTPAMLAWGAEKGWLLEVDSLARLIGENGSAEEILGGDEHDVWHDPVSNRAIKITIDEKFIQGSPERYIENLRRTNELFDTGYAFEGIVDDDGQARIVTSQPWQVGTPATVQQIDAYFADKGFSKVKDGAFYNEKTKIIVGDALPRNVMRVGNKTQPIDVQSRPATNREADKMESAIQARENSMRFMAGPLVGLPSKVNIPGVGVREFGPWQVARDVAASYMEKAGLPYNPPRTYAKVDKERAGRIAAAFDAMKHEPSSPDVAAAYQALIKETVAQWEAIKATGLKVEPVPAGAPDPYDASPRLAQIDAVENNHLWFFPTDNGFGNNVTGFDAKDNPLFEFTGETLEGGHKMRANDVFRIVHDYFGHFKEGVGFRADGEENAWRQHAAMFSPEAVGALTTETRGQNSWLNFGPYGDKNRTAKTGDTVFADQKIGLMPEWTWTEAAGDEMIDPYASKAVDNLHGLTMADEGGDTLNIDGSQYTGGGVAIPVLSKNFDNYKDLQVSDIASFINPENIEYVAAGGGILKAGIYKFPASPRASVDINIIAPREQREEGVEIAGELGQESVFDLDSFENVKTGATGDNPRKPTVEEVREIAQRLRAMAAPAELNLGRKADPAAMRQRNVKRLIERSAQAHPEANKVEYIKDGKGYRLDERGLPMPVPQEYDLLGSSLAKEAAKGKRGDARRGPFITALADKLKSMFDSIKDQPDVMAGKEWYRVAREKLVKHFGGDTLVFAQLLAATSARTPVQQNFEQALDAYNGIRSGRFNGLSERYMEAMANLEAGNLQFRQSTAGNKMGDVVTPKTFRDYLDSEGILPRRDNGKKYNANSMQVLNVIAGVWREKLGGPKTAQFSDNLTGASLEATIDVWAARTLHRLSNEAEGQRWRILPEAETGVNNEDFDVGQAAFKIAASKLGMNPDDLQGVLWFAEKRLWHARGWTRGLGSELSDFSSLLDYTEVEANGRKVLRLDRNQGMLGLDYEDTNTNRDTRAAGLQAGQPGATASKRAGAGDAAKRSRGTGAGPGAGGRGGERVAAAEEQSLFMAAPLPGHIAIYRGMSQFNLNTKAAGSHFWSTSPDFARQFTRTGQDKEVYKRQIAEDDIFTPSPLPYAGDPDQLDVAEDQAREAGKKALWADEGQGQPRSILVMERSATKPLLAMSGPEAYTTDDVEVSEATDTEEPATRYTIPQVAEAYVTDDGFIWGLETDPDKRGKGAARAIMERIIDDRGHDHLGLSAKADKGPQALPQDKLEAFYGRMGFEPEGEADANGQLMIRPPVRLMTSPTVYRGHPEGELKSRDKSLANPGNIIFSSRRQVAEHYARTTPKGTVTEASLRYSNPLTIDAGGNGYADITVPPVLADEFVRPTAQIDYLAKFAKAAGYDALIVKDVMDQWGEGDQYVVFDESQVKSPPVRAMAAPDRTPNPSLMSWMVAPNGKPTNLSPKQWNTVRTPEFKAWFGDWEKFANGKDGNGVWSDAKGEVSKIVDENGEPMLMYHGSREAGFESFDMGKAPGNRPNSAFFSNNRRVARTYSGSGADAEIGSILPDDFAEDAEIDREWSSRLVYVKFADGTEQTVEHGFSDEETIAKAVQYAQDEAFGQYDAHRGIYTVFLNIRNPLESDFEGANWDGSREGQYSVFTDDSMEEIVADENGRQYFDYETDAKELSAKHPGSVVATATDHHESTNAVAFEAEKYKNDGAIVRNVHDDGGEFDTFEASDVVIAFDPENIKDANNNNGKFDIKDSRLLFMAGPASDPKDFDSRLLNKMVKHLDAAHLKTQDTVAGNQAMVEALRQNDSNPETVKQWERKAAAMLKADKQAVIDQVIENYYNGASFGSPELAIAASMLQPEMFRDALASGDSDMMRKAQAFAYASGAGATQAGRELKALHNKNRPNKDMVRDVMASLYAAVPSGKRGRIAAAPTPMEKQKKVAELQAKIRKLEAQLREGKHEKAKELIATRQAEKAAREEKDKAQLIEAYTAARRESVVAALKAEGISEDDIFIGADDRLAAQDSDMVREAIAKHPESQHDAIRYLMRGYSHAQVAQLTKLPVPAVAALHERFRNVTLKKSVASWVNKGRSVLDLIRDGVARVFGIRQMAAPVPWSGIQRTTTTPPASKPRGPLAPKIDISVANEIDRQLAVLMPTASQVNSGRLKATVSRTKDGREATLYAKFNPDDFSSVYRVARAISISEASVFDKLYEYWINNLLSGIMTNVVNVLGNTASAAIHFLPQRALETVWNFGGALDPNSAGLGEIGEIAKGILPGIRQAMTNAWLAFNVESDPVPHLYMDEPMKIEFDHKGDIDKIGGYRGPSVGGVKGRVIRVPGRMLRAMDAAFKSMIMNMEVGAQAYRLAKVEHSKGNMVDIETFVRQQVNTPGSEAWRRSMDIAENLVFQDSNWITRVAKHFTQGLDRPVANLKQQAGELKGKGDPSGAFMKDADATILVVFAKLMQIVFPFVKTPANILRMGLRKSPLGSIMLAMHMIHAIGRGSYNIAKGKPVFTDYPTALLIKLLSEQTQAWTVVAALLSMSEGDDDDDKKDILFVGGRPWSEAGAREAVYRDYGGTYMIIVRSADGKDKARIPFGRYEPVATALGTTVDAMRQLKMMMRKSPQGATREDAEIAFKAIIGDFANQAEDKSFLQGFAGLMREYDSIKRSGDIQGGLAETAKKSLVTAIMPNLFRQTMKNIDDTVRDSKKKGADYDMLPMGKNAGPMMDMFGRDVVKDEWFPGSRLFFPAANKEQDDHPIEGLIRDWNNKVLDPKEQVAPTPMRRSDYYVYGPGGVKTKLATPSDKTVFERRIGQEFAKRTASLAKSLEGKPLPANFKDLVDAIRADVRRETRQNFITSPFQQAKDRLLNPPKQ